MARAVYESLCPKGKRIQTQANDLAVRLTEVVRILLGSEDNYPESVPRYRAELVETKAQRDRTDGELMQHVAHCNDGCIRAQGGISFAAENQPGMFDRAPSHKKPTMPGPADLAARLRDGTTLEDLAAKYERTESRLRSILNDAGFNSATGEPRQRRNILVGLAIVRVDDQPWADDALCTQTDPEAFYPEKGGSTREAKKVCASCRVQAECLDYALDHDERFGIWGGLSERERRKIKHALGGAV